MADALSWSKRGIKGLADPQFDGVGTRTLEVWAKYWRTPEQYEKEGHDKAKADAGLTVVQAEIDARTGPN